MSKLSKLSKLILSTIIFLALAFSGVGIFMSANSQEQKQRILLPAESSTTATYTFGGGDGSDSNPYKISKPRHLADLSAAVRTENSTYGSKAYILTANIDLSGKIWTPIGTSLAPFKGKFYGNGYTISNMLIEESIGLEDIGLFGRAQGPALITNFILENPYISVNGGTKRAGAVVGYYATGTDSNFYGINTVAVNGGVVKVYDTTNNQTWVGGIAGYCVTNIANSYSTATLIADTQDTIKIGGVAGLIGSNQITRSIVNTYYIGSATVKTTSITVDIANKGSSSCKISNSFFEINKNGTTSSKLYNSAGNSDSTYTTASKIKSEKLDKIYELFTINGSAEGYFIAQNNWYKVDNKYPFLRGVGNNFIAIKEESSLFDLSKNINGTNTYNTVSYSTNLSSSPSVTLATVLNDTSRPSKTWKSYIIDRVYPGSATFIESITSSSVNNTGRLYNSTSTKSISSTASSGRQVYSIVKLTLGEKLYPIAIKVRDAITEENITSATVSATKILYGDPTNDQPYQEAYFETTSSSLGSTINGGNSWSTIGTTSSSNQTLYVYATQSTKIRLHVDVESSRGYHAFKMTATNLTSYYGLVDENAEDKYETNDMATFIARPNTAEVVLGMFDTYETNYPTNNKFLSPNERYFNPLTFDGTKYYYKINGYTENKNNETYYLFANLKNKTSSKYSCPQASGYKFDGWLDDNTSIAISHNNGRPIITDEVKNLLKSKRKTITLSGKEYTFAPDAISMKASWILIDNQIKIVSILYLGDLSENQRAYQALNASTLSNTYIFTNNEVAIDVTVGSGTRFTYKAKQNNYISVRTATTIQLFNNTEDPRGYVLDGFVIANSNDENLEKAFGSFETSYNLSPTQNNRVAAKTSEEDPINLYDIHGDLTLYAVYRRGSGTVTTQIVLKTPETASELKSTDVQIDYEIRAINNTVVKSGTALVTNIQNKKVLEIPAIKTGETIILSNFVNNRPDLKFQQKEENRLEGYNSSTKNWTLKGIELEFLKGSILTDDAIKTYEVELIYRGFRLNIKLGNQYGVKQELPNAPTGLSNPLLEISTNDSLANVSYGKIENVTSGTEIVLTFSNTNYWDVVAQNYINFYLANGTNLLTLNPSIQKTVRNGNTVITISGFTGTGNETQTEFDVFVIFEKVQYLFEVKSSEKGKVVEGDKNSTTTVSQFYLTLDQTKTISAVANNGYFVETFTVYNTTNLVTGNPDYYTHTIVAKDLSPKPSKTAPIQINATFAPKQAPYQVYTILEKIDGTYDINNPDLIINGYAYTDSVLTITPQTITGFNFEPSLSTNGITIKYPDGNIVLLYYSRKTYTISYDENGGLGTRPANQAIKFGVPFELALNPFTREGYSFSSWNTQKTGSGVSLPGIGSSEERRFVINESNLNEFFAGGATSKTLYAQWIELEFTLTFDANGGTTPSVTTAKYKYTDKLTNLPTTTRLGYDFDGWYTQKTGGTKLTSNSAYYTLYGAQNGVAYAQWKPITVTVYYYLNLTGVQATIEFETKQLKTGDTFEQFPKIFFADEHSKLFSQNGWKVGNQTVVETDILPIDTENPTVVKVYAQWTLINPIIENADNWSFETEYVQQKGFIRTLVLGFGHSEGGAYISNYAPAVSGISYDLQWYKGSNLLYGYKQKYLDLKNVLDSGTYTIKIKAIHNVWGESEEVSATGTVTITPKPLGITAILTNDYLEKIYDVERTVDGNKLIVEDKTLISVTGLYETANAYVYKNNQKTNIQDITYTVTFANTKDGEIVYPENYYITFNGTPVTLTKVAGSSNKFEFTLNNGKILPRVIVLNIGDRQGFEHNYVHEVSYEIVFESVNFLNAHSHVLEGKIYTTSNLGSPTGIVYSQPNGNLDLSNLKVTHQSIDYTENYEFEVIGTYTIKKSDLKTLVIDKYASLDKDKPTDESVVITKKFTIYYQEKSLDISATKQYKDDFGDILLNVINEDDSSKIIIQAREDFAGTIVFEAPSFVYRIGTVNTNAVVYRWAINSLTASNTSTFSYKFSSISKGQQVDVQAIYRNFLLISFNSRLDLGSSQDSIYNISGGDTVRYPTLSNNGLDFLGWFDGTGENAKPAPAKVEGVGERIFYAKWKLQDIELTLLDDDSTFSEIDKTYDGKPHQVKSVISNQATIANVSYAYTWVAGGIIESKTGSYNYKNVTEPKLITFTVTATLKIGGNVVDQKTDTRTFNLTVRKFKYNYNQVIVKTYDGTNTITQNGNDFIVVDIPVSEGIVEQFKLVGTYQDEVAGTNKVVSVTFEEYNSNFLLTNFELTCTSTGTIEKIKLINVNVGDELTNTKIYDGNVFSAIKENVENDGLLSGHKLSLVIQTTSADYGVYSANDLGLFYTSFTVLNSRKDDVTQNYEIVNIVGSASITRRTIDAGKIKFDPITFVYDGVGKELYEIQADISLLGEVPSDIEFVYEWKYEGSDEYVVYGANKPVNVGVYDFRLTIVVDPENYTIIGQHPIERKLTILVRESTLNIGENTFIGKGIKTIAVNTSNYTHTVTESPLATNHYMEGSVSTNSDLPGVYENSTLVLNLTIKNDKGEDVTNNYKINVNGKITIIHKYTIIFNANGGIGSMAQVEVSWGQVFYLPVSNFYKEGYVFDAWSLTQSGEQKFASGEAVKDLSETHGGYVTFYVIWAPATNTPYRVEYYLENLSGFYENVGYDEYYNTTGYTIKFVPVYSKAPYIDHFIVEVYDGTELVDDDGIFEKGFTGFTLKHVEESVLTGVVNPSASQMLTLKIYFERNSYKITFRPNNFELPTEASYKFEQQIALSNIPNDVKNLTRPGYDFDGWYLNWKTSQEEPVKWPYKMPANDVNMTAKWKAHTNTGFTIEYYYQEVDGSYPTKPSAYENYSTTTDKYAQIEFTITGGNVVEANLVVYDDEQLTTIFESARPISLGPKGFKLINYPQGQVLGGVIDASNGLKLKLYFDRLYYSITYVYNNGEDNKVELYRYQTQINQPVSPTFTGYTFAGWFFDENLEGTIVSWPHVLNDDTTIYAKWTANTNTPFKLTIFKEGLEEGSYSTSSTHTFYSTTDYYAEFVLRDNLFLVDIYKNKDKKELIATEGPFNQEGFSQLDTSHQNYSAWTIVEGDGNGEIVVYFKRDRLTITYEFNDGVTPNLIVNALYGSVISAPQDPTRDGYVFIGWFADKDLTQKVNWPITLTSNKTFYARWIGQDNIEWKITTYKQNANLVYELVGTESYFGTNGHYVAVVEKDGVWKIAIFEDENKEKQDKDWSPIELILEGYTFSLNNQDLETDLKKQISTSVVAELVIYFNINSHSFTINYNDKVTPNEVHTVIYNQNPPLPTSNPPTRQGYVFGGWYEDLDFEISFDFEGFKMPDKNVTVYAKWNPATNTPFKVEFYLEQLAGGYDTLPFAVENKQGTTNHYLEISVAERRLIIWQDSSKTVEVKSEALSTFAGFTITSHALQKLESSILADGSAVLKVYYSRNTYTVKFVFDNGKDDAVYENRKYESTIEIDAPTKAGYDFAGWFKNSSLTTSATWTEENGKHIFTVGAENATYFAKWTARNDTQYKVKHYHEQADSTNFEFVEEKDYTGITDTIASATVLTYNGFTFDNTNPNNKLTGNINGDGSLVLEVYYVRTIYQLVFDGNGATGGTMENQPFKYGKSQNLNENQFTRKGYKFEGWDDTPTGVDFKYTNGGPFVFDYAENKTIYAKWSIIPLNTENVILRADKTLAYYGNTIQLSLDVPDVYHQANINIKYEWFKDSVKLPNATESSLTLNSIEQSGIYFVRVYIDGKDTTGVINNSSQAKSNEVFITIAKRQLVVNYNPDQVLVYGKVHRAPTFTLDYNTQGEIELPIVMPSTVVTYYYAGEVVNSTVNVGLYEFKVDLVENTNFELVGENRFSYNISKLEWDVTALVKPSTFVKGYDSSDPVLKINLTHPTTGDILLVTFTRQTGEDVGKYDLTNPETENPNYTLTIQENNLGFEIVSNTGTEVVIRFRDSSLLTKVYDGEIIDLNSESFSLSNIITIPAATITNLKFRIPGNSKNAGEYLIEIEEVEIVEYSKYKFNSVYYVIVPRTIDYATTTLSKTYDGNNIIKLNYTGVLEEDDKPGMVEVYGELQTSNVGTGILITAKLIGSEAKNYKLSNSFAGLYGAINPMAVKVVPLENLTFVYGDFTDETLIPFEAWGKDQSGSFTIPISASNFTGKLNINKNINGKYSVGLYQISGGSLLVTSENYVLFDVQTEYLEITKRPITAYADWDKIYDGTNAFTKSITLNGKLDADEVYASAVYASAEVGTTTLSLTLYGKDKDNYQLVQAEVEGQILNKIVYARLNYGFENLNTPSHSQPTSTQLELIYNKTIEESGYATLPQPTAIGYAFIGWFDAVEGGNEFTSSTLIGGIIWPTDVEEKNLYARWAEGSVILTVGVISYNSKPTGYVVEIMDGTPLASGTFSINDVSYETLGTNQQSFGFMQQVIIVATPNANYEFDGWYASHLENQPKLATSEGIIVNGNQITLTMNNNIKIYAKFKLSVHKLTLNINSQSQTSLGYPFNQWDGVMQGDNYISISSNFDHNDQVTLPTNNELSRTGYELLGWWTSATAQPGDELITGKITVTENTTLYAIWKANSYIATFIANTGDESDLLVNADKGRFENPTDPMDNGKITKIVNFDSAIGAVETPIRKRYVFAGWYDNPDFTGTPYTEQSLYTFSEDKTFYAKWEEQEFEIKINVNLPVGGNVIIENTPGVLSINKQQYSNKEVYTVKLKASTILTFTTTLFNGYKLTINNPLTNGINIVENVSQVSSSLQKVELSRFAQEFEININFKAELFAIIVNVNDSKMGAVSASIENKLDEQFRNSRRDDGDYISETISDGNKVITVLAYTGETITLTLIENFGYRVFDFEVIYGDGAFGVKTGNTITFSGFTQISQIKVYFEKQEIAVSVQIGKNVISKETSNKFGSFGALVENQAEETRVVVENTNFGTSRANVVAYTEETIILEIATNHGYVLSNNPDDWTFEKENPLFSNVKFDLTQVEQGIVKIYGFNGSGTVIIPFKFDLFSFEIKLALYDNDEFTEITSNYSIFANITVNNIPIQNNQYYYETIMDLSALANSANGYELFGWYENLSPDSKLWSSENYSSYVLKDNSIIYFVVSLKKYKVNYEVFGKGTLDPFISETMVKHGYGIEQITATSELGYEFNKWEIYNFELEEWQEDSVFTEPNRTDSEITSNLKVRAVFVPKTVQITVNSIYYKSFDVEKGRYVEGEMTENIGTISQFEVGQKQISFTLLATTEQPVRLVAEPNIGFKINGWRISPKDSFVQIVFIDGQSQLDIRLENFVDGFTITAIFEAQENLFEIAIVKYNGSYSFTKENYIDAGLISIDPTRLLEEQANQPRTKAKARTGDSFEITFQIFKGYELVYDELNSYLPKVGVKYDHESEVQFLDEVAVEELSGMFTKQVRILFTNFRNSGTVVIYLELTPYDVEFIKTPEESKVFQLTIGDNFANIDEDYKIPQREGYIFRGWYSHPQGSQGLLYIDEIGQTQNIWNIEHRTLYAHWTKKFVTYYVTYNPGPHALGGTLIWDNNPEKEYSEINDQNVRFYVGSNNVYIIAPTGNEGYIFSHWLLDEQVVSYDTEYVFSIPFDETNLHRNLTAVYKVRIMVTATVGGSAKVDNELETYLLPGEQAQLTAVANNGYLFTGWRVGTDIVSTQSTYTINYSPTALVYTAVFEGKKVEIIIEQDENGKVISWTANNQIVSPENGKYFVQLGDRLRFDVEPSTGYRLSGWYLNDQYTSPFNYYEVTVQDVNRPNFKVKPVFQPAIITYTIKYNTAHGSVVMSEQEISSGQNLTTTYIDTIKLTIKANIRYRLEKVTLNGTQIDESYLTPSGQQFILNLPSNLLQVSGSNTLEINYLPLYWIDVRQSFDGLGTKSSPYIILSPQHFAEMAFLINNNIAVDAPNKVEYASAYYIVSSTIDFGERFWIPIGTKEHPFKGTIELNYSRRNIYLDPTQQFEVTNYGGLFGYIDLSAAKIIENKTDFTTGIIVISSFGGVLIVISTVFFVGKNVKKKRINEKTTAFPLTKDTLPKRPGRPDLPRRPDKKE